LNGGPLGLKSIQIIDTACGFSFLGYWIKTVGAGDREIIRVTPSHSAKQKLRRKLFKRLRRPEPDLDFDSALFIANSYVPQWLKGFPLWAYSSDELDDLHSQVLTWVDDYFSGYLRKPGVQLERI
jgi:hypothetical protein